MSLPQHSFKGLHVLMWSDLYPNVGKMFGCKSQVFHEISQTIGFYAFGGNPSELLVSLILDSILCFAGLPISSLSLECEPLTLKLCALNVRASAASPSRVRKSEDHIAKEVTTAEDGLDFPSFLRCPVDSVTRALSLLDITTIIINSNSTNNSNSRNTTKNNQHDIINSKHSRSLVIAVLDGGGLTGRSEIHLHIYIYIYIYVYIYIYICIYTSALRKF